MLSSEEFESEMEQKGLEVASHKTHIKYLTSPWYKEIVEYLLTLSCPPSCDKAKYKALRLNHRST